MVNKVKNRFVRVYVYLSLCDFRFRGDEANVCLEKILEIEERDFGT
jgi:hypothetical protein